jgi:hypothetical protein
MWYILSNGTLHNTGAWLAASSHISLKQLSQETGQPKLPVCAATKLLCWNPYKFTVVQNFQAAGYAGRAQFCNWFCEAVCSGDVVCLLNCLTDEEQLYLNSYKDIQNKRYYWVDNPIVLHGMPLYDFGVWHAVSVTNIFRTSSFLGTVNWGRYIG